MSAEIFVPALFGVILAVYAGIIVGAWRRTRGSRVVECPHSQRLALVGLDTGHAIAGALCEGSEPRVKKCSRWPEHEQCDRACAPAAAATRRVGEA